MILVWNMLNVKNNIYQGMLIGIEMNEVEYLEITMSQKRKRHLFEC